MTREKEVEELQERIIHINRVAKVVKGGRRFSFSALVVVGDGKGRLGVGLGKANEVPEAIQKANEQARKNLFKIPLYKQRTIPHDVMGHFGAGLILLRPASPGTGVIAGGTIRAIVEVAGVQAILSKCLRTSNPNAVVYATIKALQSLKEPEEIARNRGKLLSEIRI